MIRSYSVCILALAGLAAAGDDQIVFRSDVSLARVDAQVVDGSNRAITHLNVDDFVVLADGKPQRIQTFGSENFPIDILFLLDVSASMKPHVQHIADASGQAMTVLGKDDRMGIMVFDRTTRVRIGFRSNRQDVQHEFDQLLRQERFNGGTDITRGMLDAADYMRREGRKDARHAIVILTDDETEFDRDDASVSRALARADAVLCALIAPNAMDQNQGRYPGGGNGGGQRRGGGWGGGPSIGGGLGGVILGRGGNSGGNRGPGGGTVGGHRTKSAGTSEIARDSGGDSMSVYGASALEETLSRIRQRYALYFNLPGAGANVSVDLSPAARRRFSDAEIRYRRVNMTGDSSTAPVQVTRAPSDRGYSTAASRTEDSSVNSDSAPAVRKRRVAVNEDGTPISRPPDDSTDPDVKKKP